MGALPAIAYDSDLGFQYGVLTNLYNFNAQHPYPVYANSLYLEASKYTAGSALVRAYWDSRQLLGSVRFNFDCTYIRDLTNDFFGFNGAATIYNNRFEDEDAQSYISRVFYKYDSKMWRLMMNLKGSIGISDFYWMTGVTYWDIKTNSVDVAKLNKQHPKDPLPMVEGLYDKYVDWGLIKDDEKNGGRNAQVRIGAGLDSRDYESNPSKGVWSEVLVSAIPSLFSSHGIWNLQLTAIHRHYATLVPKKTIAAYRLQYQTLMGGSTPFYLLSNIPTPWPVGAYSEGMGGARTLRGVRRNRVIGNGFVLANLELRQKLVSFNWFRQDFYIATNLFSDAGLITKKYNVNLDNVPGNERAVFFSGKDDHLHVTYGLGLKLAMNENFIVSADYGRATRSDDGESGLYINLNYLF